MITLRPGVDNLHATFVSPSKRASATSLAADLTGKQSPRDCSTLRSVVVLALEGPSKQATFHFEHQS